MNPRGFSGVLRLRMSTAAMCGSSGRLSLASDAAAAIDFSIRPVGIGRPGANATGGIEVFVTVEQFFHGDHVEPFGLDHGGDLDAAGAALGGVLACNGIGGGGCVEREKITARAQRRSGAETSGQLDVATKLLLPRGALVPVRFDFGLLDHHDVADVHEVFDRCDQSVEVGPPVRLPLAIVVTDCCGQ